MSGGRHILVVDDDASTREMLHLALLDNGYEVRTAPNGAVALDVALGWPPDLVLLNLRMPVMDGQTFSDAHDRLPLPRAPIIVVSALSGVEEQLDFVDPDAFVAKPFDLDTLFARIAQHVPPDARRDTSCSPN